MSVTTTFGMNARHEMPAFSMSEQLELAERYIEQGERRLQLQEERVEQLRQAGRNVDHEEQLVGIMRDLLDTMRAHRELIQRTLADRATPELH